MKKTEVVLFFRKLRDTGNFSIEKSFERMADNFPQESEFTLRPYVSSYFSNGIIPRVKGIIEARRCCGAINHVTGDVHYLVFGLTGRKTLLTIHDCGFMTNPNPLARRLLKWFWLDFPVLHCKYVTAVSEATKQDIIRYTRCPPDKVMVVPTVIADDFHWSSKPFNARCPRILHIGLAPNKNFERHVEAVSGIECHFHIIGKLNSSQIRSLEKYNVCYTAEYNISKEDMQSAYAESDLLLFASTLEGFGMPILEAQTVGRPVIASDLSSMPEVAGGGACLVDPYSVKSIRAGLLRVIGDSEYRNDLVDRGLRNINRYNAETVASQYAKIYAMMKDT